MTSLHLCQHASELPELIRGELDEGRVQQLESHLDTCVSCRQALETLMQHSKWWREVHDALGEADMDQEDSPYVVALSMLGPTDDPTRLGRIGSYEVVGILGHGGMGIVFKGFDPSLNRFVAIKVLLPHLAASGAARRRFAREAQAAAAVVDDHVMAIHGVSEWKGLPFLVMPYTKGASLQKRLTEQGPLELREILRIGSQAAKGLAAAHAQGLVHRDIKPANIILNEGLERVTLTDFGLARAVDDASLTRTGTLTGTPQYMSPEQSCGKPIDHRSDLFSLGSVLYALCTGRPPFRAESSYAILRKITDEEPRPIRELNPDIPNWLCKIIGKLMEKSPENRYRTAAEVGELLEKCLAHVQQPTIVPLPDPFPRPAVQGLIGYSPRIGWMACGFVLASMLAMGWFALTWSDRDGSMRNLLSNRSLAPAPSVPFDPSVPLAAKKDGVPPIARTTKRIRRAQPYPAPREVPEEKLRDRLLVTVECDFSGTSWKTAIESLLQGQKIPFDFHHASLNESGVDSDRPCRLRSTGSLRDALRRLLEPLGLTYMVHDNYLEIVSIAYAETHPTLRIYDLSMLAATANEAESLVEIVNTLMTKSDTMTIHPLDRTLVVKATEQVHYHLEILLYSLTSLQP